MRLAILAVFLLLITALGIALGGYYWWPTYQVEQRVKRALNDPESARFRDINFNRSNKAGCGVVNAKNKMGGYVGDTHFVTSADGDVTFQPPDDSAIGSLDDQIASLEKQVKYLELAGKFCLDKPKKDGSGKAP